MEAAGVKLARSPRHLVALVKRVGVTTSLALVLNFCCAVNNLVGFFSRRQVAIVYRATEKGLARSAGVAKSGRDGEHGLSTEFDENVDQSAGEKNTLRSSLADIDA